MWKLSSYRLGFVEVVSGALESTPIKFCNLKCLELGTCLSRDCINTIMYLLKIGPIKSIILEIENSFGRAKYPFLDEVHLNSAKIQEWNHLGEGFSPTSKGPSQQDTKSWRDNFRKQLQALSRASSSIEIVLC